MKKFSGLALTLSYLAVLGFSGCAHLNATGARGLAALAKAEKKSENHRVLLQARASKLAARVRHLKSLDGATETRVQTYLDTLLSTQLQGQLTFQQTDLLLREFHSRLLVALDRSGLKAGARESLLTPVRSAYWKVSRSHEMNLLQQIALLEEQLEKKGATQAAAIRFELERVVFAVDEPSELSEKLLRLLADDTTLLAQPAVTRAGQDARKRARELLGKNLS